jgi:hypothetical protein
MSAHGGSYGSLNFEHCRFDAIFLIKTGIDRNPVAGLRRSREATRQESEIQAQRRLADRIKMLNRRKNQ